MTDRTNERDKKRPAKRSGSKKRSSFSQSLLDFGTPFIGRALVSMVAKQAPIRHSNRFTDFQVLPLRATKTRMHLVPQAIISEPVETFARYSKANIEEDHDNLDYYRGVAYALNGMHFAVMHYQGHPEESSTIYLPKSIHALDDITDAINNIIAHFRIPRSSLIWERRNDPNL